MRHIDWQGTCDHLEAVIEGVVYVAEFQAGYWTVYRETPYQVIRPRQLVLHYEYLGEGAMRFVSCNTLHGRCTHCYLRSALSRKLSEFPRVFA